MSNPIYDDPIVAEVHAIRQALLDDCGGDMDEYRRRIQERQAKSGRRIITSPLKKRPKQGVLPETPNLGVPDGQSNTATG